VRDGGVYIRPEAIFGRPDHLPNVEGRQSVTVIFTIASKDGKPNVHGRSTRIGPPFRGRGGLPFSPVARDARSLLVSSIVRPSTQQLFSTFRFHPPFHRFQASVVLPEAALVWLGFPHDEAGDAALKHA
jgi:hypothetical protein